MSLMYYFQHRARPKGRTESPGASGFRRKLVTTLAVGIVILLVSSLLAAWIIGSWVERVLESQMEQAARDFARHSVMVFLVRDPELARSRAATMHAFPWVHSVEFLDKDYKPLPKLGNEKSAPTALTHAPLPERSGVHRWDQDNLTHLVIPVKTHTESSPLERSAATGSTEALGYVHLTLDKAWVAHFRIGIGLAYVLIMGVSALGLLIWFRRRVGILDAEVDLMTAGLREAYSATLTASRHKSEFLATITHELRTPIASIGGYAELALQDLRFAENAGPARKRIQSVQEIAGNILNRVGDILIFAQAEAGKTDITISKIELRPFIHQLAALYQPLLIEKGNELTLAISGAECVCTDESKLFHIVSNLLANACKFTEQGTVKITVTAVPDTLTIVIDDNGIGIEDAHLREVFEPFYQADMSDTRAHSGVGLGLAIAKRYCELLGGTIKVTSEPAVGSRFEVDIPVAQCTSSNDSVR